MAYSIDLQNASHCADVPKKKQFQAWVHHTLLKHRKSATVTIRIVDENESAHLNETFRHKHGPTNILSFPFAAPVRVKTNLLGDLIICAPLVEKEAKQQCKKTVAHWAHLTIHGTLHLLGYDHIDDNDAAIMECIEIKTMKKLGYPNPYIEI